MGLLETADGGAKAGCDVGPRSALADETEIEIVEIEGEGRI